MNRRLLYRSGDNDAAYFSGGLGSDGALLENEPASRPAIAGIWIWLALGLGAWIS